MVVACFAGIVLANPAHVCQLKPCHWLILVVEVHLLSFLWAWCDKSPKMSFMASHEVCNTVASAVCLWKYGSYFQIRWWVMNFPLQKRLILGYAHLCTILWHTQLVVQEEITYIYIHIINCSASPSPSERALLTVVTGEAGRMMPPCHRCDVPFQYATKVRLDWETLLDHNSNGN